jgi:hypothetical protein
MLKVLTEILESLWSDLAKTCVEDNPARMIGKFLSGFSLVWAALTLKHFTGLNSKPF